MGRRTKDGHTRREHYEAAGIPQDQWGIPSPPLLLWHVWGWFCDLAERRKKGVDGPCELEWGEMKAYFEMQGERPSKFELSAICAIDRIALTEPKKK